MNPLPYAAAAAALCIFIGPALSDPEMSGRDSGISLPADFRATLTHLGSWYVPEGEASGFHDVYASPDAVTYYRENGSFPDGAILVKELRGSEAADYSTGKAVRSASRTVKQWFVMVRDSSGRRAGSPLWGDGWGWGLFRPDQPQRNVASDYRTDCLGCHLPARDTELVYTHAYPTLLP